VSGGSRIADDCLCDSGVETERAGRKVVIEVPLSAEEAVVDKRIVAKERVSLDKDV
jgi:hypothetical protein